jgi:Ca2+-transporting ATPase
MNFYQGDVESLTKILGSSSSEGLSDKECAERISKNGYNRISKSEGRSTLTMFIEQFKNLLVILLIMAAILSFFLKSYRDGVILVLVIFFNAAIGFYQDWKSENILASLKDLIIPKCNVIRNGKQIEIPSDNLVSGDIVILLEGDGVPADIRLVDSTGFFTNDFILTGESQPTAKSHKDLITKEGATLSEQTNSVFMGTTVAKGEATGIVFATGMNTALGKIAKSSAAIDASKTPLQKELDGVAKKITYATLIISGTMLAGRLFYGDKIEAAIIFAIGVAAAMVPEGLPAQISVSLALGVARLAKNKAVVKKLSSVEALGAATVIASDKTGTITKNEMTIIHCHLNGTDYMVTGTGYEPKGEILDMEGRRLLPGQIQELEMFFMAGVLASTGRISPPDTFHNYWYPIGDPTDCAFSTLMMKAGISSEDFSKNYPRLQLFPFDSVRKRISIVREYKGKQMAFLKGSIESILEISNRTTEKGVERQLTASDKERYLDISKIQAAQGKRIIALAIKELPINSKFEAHEVENNALFIGFATMHDPPHEEVKEAIETAFRAKMKVFMITGDNEVTARAIAVSVGITNEDNKLPRVISADALKQMNDDEVKEKMQTRALIFSRVSPDDKLRIVSLLKEMGEVVAVTGDGVNDTLSLKKADIGIAMAKSGSKVAQDAANMVLLDDNFSTIVLAIREGRVIYNNLKKVVLANLINNLAELVCILIGFVAAYYGRPLVLMPVHILLIDLVGNMIPLITVTYDPAESNLMEMPPRKQGEMLNRGNLITILYSGLISGLIAFAVYSFSYASRVGQNLQCETAVTVTMTTLIICQFINILSSRTERTIFTSYFFSNKLLFGGFTLSLLFLLGISYFPYTNVLLHTGPMSLRDWLFISIGALTYLVFLEITKLFKRKFLSNPIKAS